MLALNAFSGNYHTEHLLKMHEYIFQDLFEWAGMPRTISIYKEEDVSGGLSIEYSDSFDIVNDMHHTLSDMRAKNWAGMTTRRRHAPEASCSRRCGPPDISREVSSGTLRSLPAISPRERPDSPLSYNPPGGRHSAR